MPEGLQQLVGVEDRYEVNGNRSTVLRIIPPIIISEDIIAQLKMSLMSYLNPDTSEGDLDSDYCLDFGNVTSFSSAAIGGMRLFNGKHQTLRNKPVAIAACTGQPYTIFAGAKLITTFNFFYTLDDYKRSR
ncbi:MAG: hypothetical protein RL557_22 [archaeon]|jgi:hypothetical protein